MEPYRNRRRGYYYRRATCSLGRSEKRLQGYPIPGKRCNVRLKTARRDHVTGATWCTWYHVVSVTWARVRALIGPTAIGGLHKVAGQDVHADFIHGGTGPASNLDPFASRRRARPKSGVPGPVSAVRCIVEATSERSRHADLLAVLVVPPCDTQDEEVRMCSRHRDKPRRVRAGSSR